MTSDPSCLSTKRHRNYTGCW